MHKFQANRHPDTEKISIRRTNIYAWWNLKPRPAKTWPAVITFDQGGRLIVCLPTPKKILFEGQCFQHN